MPKGSSLKNESCTSCWEMEGCNDCYFENETENCTECFYGYFFKDGNCSKCSDERCDNVILKMEKNTVHIVMMMDICLMKINV